MTIPSLSVDVGGPALHPPTLSTTSPFDGCRGPSPTPAQSHFRRRLRLICSSYLSSIPGSDKGTVTHLLLKIDLLYIWSIYLYQKIMCAYNNVPIKCLLELLEFTWITWEYTAYLVCHNVPCKCRLYNAHNAFYSGYSTKMFTRVTRYEYWEQWKRIHK